MSMFDPKPDPIAILTNDDDDFESADESEDFQQLGGRKLNVHLFSLNLF